MQTLLIVTLLFFPTRMSFGEAEKSIQWAGYKWNLRDDENSGPGPNDWDSKNAWVDEDHKLHLKLRRSPTTGRWTCAELYTDAKFGFGTYRWFVEGTLDQLDTNVVFGLFTYGGVDRTNEIDIEAARWGQTDSEASNLFYTVYPDQLNAAEPVSSGTRLVLEGTYTTHQFTWTPHHVAFQVQGGFSDHLTKEEAIFSYQTPASFQHAMPHINAPLHINLWAFEGKPPTDGEEVEIVIHDFKFIKA